MLRLSNISIGMKMAAMSAVSILLVFGMIGAQLLGNARTRSPFLKFESYQAALSSL
jgi:hypothetical protein